MSVKVTDKDHGFKKTIAAIEKAGGASLTVGVHDEEGGATTPSGMTVSEVATINEYGLGPPERSFIRAWVDSYESQHAANIKKMAQAVIKGTLTTEQALERLGLLYVGLIQARIAGGIDPPNAQSTIDKKGSSVPLVDKGQLRSSIRHKVGKE